MWVHLFATDISATFFLCAHIFVWICHIVDHWNLVSPMSNWYLDAGKHTQHSTGSAVLFLHLYNNVLT